MEYGEKNSGATDVGEYPIKYSKVAGAEYPLIQINNILYKQDEIINMTIDTSGFLPTISIRLLMKSKIPYTAGFPIDGDLVSIFIRSKDDSFKPIRNDYSITSIKVNSSGRESSFDTMDISGVLSVPGIRDMRCVSYKGTSLDVLQRIAEDLNLGFATNEISTKDEQVWINPYRSMESFIQEICNASFKDDGSFFTCFVDIFYNLNFVNVDPLFSVKPGMETGLTIENFTQDYDIDSKLSKEFINILFTNNNLARYGSFHIKKYEQVNKSNFINRNEGYVKFNHYYDSLLKKKVLFFNDPKTTPGAENGQVILKGRRSEDRRFNLVSHNWMGTIYGINGENQHWKYLYAKTWNYQNMMHLDKFHLKVELQQINMSLRKYQVIPLLITVTEDLERRAYNDITSNDAQNTSPGQNEAERTTEQMSQNAQFSNGADKVSQREVPFVVEKFYTGNYVTQGIQYMYSNGTFTANLKLLRREWPVPPQLHS
jgi:hypothetical protein